MLHVKRTKVKGKLRLYFRTGQKNARGHEILARLPAINDPGFGDSYAAYMAARTRRANARVATAADLTVASLRELYERSAHYRRLSIGTKRIYGISLDYLVKMLPTAPARELERKDVLRLRDGRGETPGAANSLLRSISALYRWAREAGHVENDPCRDIRELELGEHQPWPPHIVAAALSTGDDRVRLAVHLLLYTGQRIGDVVKMKWTDLSVGSDGFRRITVEQQKTGRHLVIPLHDDLRRELERHSQSLGYLITGVQGRPIEQKTLRRCLQEFAATIGTKIVPHGLRKNAVNALLEAGCSAAETAAITGQSLQMVEHYAKGRSQQTLASAAIIKWQGHKA